MTIIVEDGTLVTNANSYVTDAEFTTYLTDRGYTVTATHEPLLIRAYDLMLTLPWIFSITAAYTVTPEMKKAQNEIAYQMSLGFNPSAIAERSIESEKVDVIETSFFKGSAGVVTSPLSAIRLLPIAFGYISNLLDCSQTLLRA